VKPEVSVVIPMYNAAGTIGEQLDALAAQEYSGRWEVVIADNGSTDDGADVALGWSDRLPELRIVDASAKRGVSHARNTGAAAARGDLVLICDADDVVAPGWLAAMAAAGADCDVLGGSVEDERLNDPLVRAWRWYPRNRLPTVLGFLSYADGMNCGMRKRVFEDLGGFDEGYVAGGDDVEFSWRAQLAGYKLCFVPEAVVSVRYRTGLKALARQFYFYGRATPQLYRDFRGRGAPRRSLGTTAADWLWLLWHVPHALGSRRARGTWIRRAALGWGYVRGSFRWRVRCL
jgi:GT2 family glycosyltransferase